MGIFRINGMLAAWNGSLVRGEETVPPEPGSLPSDMDFVYLATNFDGTKIVNAAPNSTFGDYLAMGTVSKSGTGASCDLYTDNTDGNYLYRNLTSAQLDAMKAINGTYTYFVRMVANAGGVGGVVSFRQESGGYNYMIRCNDGQLQLHTYYGQDLGEDFEMDDLNPPVFKVQVSGASFYAKNMRSGVTAAYEFSSDRDMGSIMTSISAGYSGENNIYSFYGLAGIARATTAEEDDAIAACLTTQET